MQRRVRKLRLAQVYLLQGKIQPMLVLREQCISVFERLDAILDLATARALGETVSQTV